MFQLLHGDRRLSEVGEVALVSLQFNLGFFCEVFHSVLGGLMFLFCLVGGFFPFLFFLCPTAVSCIPPAKAKEKKKEQMKHLSAGFSKRVI